MLRDQDAEEILPYEADDSPFPEVRAVVRPVDDLSLPVNTVRMWLIGLVFTIVRLIPEKKRVAELQILTGMFFRLAVD